MTNEYRILIVKKNGLTKTRKYFSNILVSSVTKYHRYHQLLFCPISGKPVDLILKKFSEGETNGRVTSQDAVRLTSSVQNIIKLKYD